LRVAEFAQLFAAAARTIVRASPTSLHLVLDGDATEAAARELAARETECCSFFTFTFHPASDEASAGLELTVAVPATHVGVLDGLNSSPRPPREARRQRDRHPGHRGGHRAA
jgi:hypothetical protein